MTISTGDSAREHDDGSDGTQQVERRVRVELEGVSRVDAETIAGSVDHSVARLDGEVRDLAADRYAREAVIRADGITAVIDALRASSRSLFSDSGLLAGEAVEHLDTELPMGPSSPVIEQRIRQALAADGPDGPDSIVVRVVGSEVTLEGAVRSYDDRRRAARAAWSSPHVTLVRNHIHVRL